MFFAHGVSSKTLKCFNNFSKNASLRSIAPLGQTSIQHKHWIHPFESTTNLPSQRAIHFMGQASTQLLHFSHCLLFMEG